MADLPKPKIAIMDTPVPNAFATGRSPKHAAVCVTTGLWNRLEPKEIEGVLAHELSHIANRDVLIMTVASFFAMLAAMLTRFGLYAGMFGAAAGNRDNNNGPPVWLIVLRRLDRRLRDQLRPDPDDLALPRVRGRPRLGADHRRARVPDERAAEDLVADDADPEAGPAPGRGHERVLHHPGQGEGHHRPSSSWITRRSRSASPRSPRSRARWAARSPEPWALRRRPLRAQEALRAAGRPAVRADDRGGHARDGARADDGGRGGGHVQAALVGRLPQRVRRHRGADRRRRAAVRLARSSARPTSTASTG